LPTRFILRILVWCEIIAIEIHCNFDNIHRLASLIESRYFSCEIGKICAVILVYKGLRVYMYFKINTWSKIWSTDFTLYIYRVFHKSLRDIRLLRYSSRYVHAEGGQVNRGRDTPGFCPTLQVLDSSFLQCLSSLLHSRVRKFRSDLRITLYILRCLHKEPLHVFTFVT
jgi:hypothetical protein